MRFRNFLCQAEKVKSISSQPIIIQKIRENRDSIDGNKANGLRVVRLCDSVCHDMVVRGENENQQNTRNNTGNVISSRFISSSVFCCVLVCVYVCLCVVVCLWWISVFFLRRVVIAATKEFEGEQHARTSSSAPVHTHPSFL